MGSPFSARRRTSCRNPLFSARLPSLDGLYIGGGFPVKYIDEDINLESMCKTIVDHYRKLFGEEVMLVAEPGRSVVGDAAILVTKVISESVREGRNWLYFDDGTFTSAPMIDPGHPCDNPVAMPQLLHLPGR